MYRSPVSKFWSEPQDEELRQLRILNLNMEEIARRTGRTPSAIRSRLCVLGLHHRKTHRPWKDRMVAAVAKSVGAYEKTQHNIIEQDLAFQRAMKVAIHMGMEDAPIGVSVNKKPFSSVVRLVHPTLAGSSSGSPAASCAALGAKNSFG